MGTVVGRGHADIGERPVTVLVPVSAEGDGSDPDIGEGWMAGPPEVVSDGAEANGTLARAEASGARLLVALGGIDSTAIGGIASTAIGGIASTEDASDRALVAIAGLRSGDLRGDPPLGLALVEISGAAPVEARSRGLVAPEALLDRPTGPTGPGASMVVGVAAAVAVGGFDADQPGLGWVDLADRLSQAGRPVLGVETDALPFVSALTASLAPADRIETEGRWLRARAGGPIGRLRFERYRRRVLRAVGRARAIATDAGELDRLAELDRVEEGARRGWRGQRPHEAQRGVGRRADWRHLLTGRSARAGSALAVVGLGPVESWRWLVDDGWARRVTTDLAPELARAPEPAADPAVHLADGPARAAEPAGPVGTVEPVDTVVIGAAARRVEPGVVARAAAAVADGGSVVVLVDPVRRPGRNVGHRPVVDELRRAGLTTVRRYLALPDAEGPKRYIPLDDPGGPAWLAGSAPALGAAELPRRRRLLRHVVRRLAPVVPELLGGVVVVASSTPPIAGERPAIVVTSGFDEGSRTVVLPLGADGRPSRVVKISARPAYRANAEREHELLRALAPWVRPGLVPTPIERIDDGDLHAVVESYAGRWTVTDVLNEQGGLAERSGLLAVALDAIGDLARTPPPADPASTTVAPAAIEPWGPDGFEELIGRWFDQLDDRQGSSPTRAALRRALAERSEALEGRSLPIGVRHFDLGPWNMVLADGPGSAGPDALGPRSPVTVVDWELAPPRRVAAGPVGADHVYFTKYWLHIAAGCRSIDDEQSAFAFLGSNDSGAANPATPTPTPAAAAHSALAVAAADLDLSLGFLPLLEAHVWAEAACFTSERRRDRGGDGGSPARYLDTVARHRVALLDAWPV